MMQHQRRPHGVELAQQIDRNNDVNDRHGRHVEHRQIIRDAELRRIHAVLEGGDVRVGKIERPDDIEEPDHWRREDAAARTAASARSASTVAARSP